MDRFFGEPTVKQKEFTLTQLKLYIANKLKPQEYVRYELEVLKFAVLQEISTLEGRVKKEIIMLTNQTNELVNEKSAWLNFSLRERLLPEEFDLEAEVVRYYAVKNNIRIIEKIPKK